jgi:hypothetical protein
MALLDLRHILLLFSAISPYTLAQTALESLLSCRGVPLLPRSLNTVGFLVPTSEMHIWGEYILQTFPGSDASENTISFTIDKPSYIRISVQPDDMDIDLFLRAEHVNGMELVQSRLVTREICGVHINSPFKENSFFIFFPNLIISFDLLLVWFDFFFCKFFLFCLFLCTLNNKQIWYGCVAWWLCSVQSAQHEEMIFVLIDKGSYQIKVSE